MVKIVEHYFCDICNSEYLKRSEAIECEKQGEPPTPLELPAMFSLKIPKESKCEDKYRYYILVNLDLPNIHKHRNQYAANIPTPSETGGFYMIGCTLILSEDNEQIENTRHPSDSKRLTNSDIEQLCEENEAINGGWELITTMADNMRRWEATEKKRKKNMKQ